MKIKKKFGDCEEDKQTTIRKNKQETTEMKEKQKWKTMKTRMRQKTTKKKKRRSKQSFSAVYLPERTNEEVLKDTSYFFIQLLIFFSFFVCRYTIYQHIFSNSDSSFHSHACLYIACFVILRILLMMKIQRKKRGCHGNEVRMLRLTALEWNVKHGVRGRRFMWLASELRLLQTLLQEETQ